MGNEGGLIEEETEKATKQDKTKAEKKSKAEVKKNFFDLIREKVSTTKYRYQNKDFNLDLTYITNRIIACGFPAEGMEALYRNKKEDLVRFFNVYHGRMVKVYNLCAEASHTYDQRSIEPCALGRFPFPDHNVPPIEKMYNFCLDACLYLQRMEQYIHKKK